MSRASIDMIVFVAAIASGLVAGVFFAFSNFVMAGLRRAGSATGSAAMNAINVAAINPAFMLALFGTGLLCLALAAIGFGVCAEMRGKLLLGAGAIYVIGCVGVTIARNAAQRRARGGAARYRAMGAVSARVDAVESCADCGGVGDPVRDGGVWMIRLFGGYQQPRPRPDRLL
jgi:uncharacterized membrane protein